MGKSSQLELRCTSASNPLGLTLGEEVHITAKVSLYYDSKGEKVLCRIPTEQIAIIVGTSKKALGTYSKNRGYYEDYEQASLKVSRYVRLYECKINVNDKPFLVQPDDIVVD